MASVQATKLTARHGTGLAHAAAAVCNTARRPRAALLPSKSPKPFCNSSQSFPRLCFASRVQKAAAFKVYAVEQEEDIEVEEVTMERMEKCIESVKRNFASVRTGRASPAMLDRIEVDYYGAMTPLISLAGVSVPEATMLVIQPYDSGSIGAVEKALQTSDLGLTPSNDGKIIRLRIPSLTAERRKEMTKLVSKIGEEGKVALRNVRRDSMKSIEKLRKADAISEDVEKSLEESVQSFMDDYVKSIDKLTKQKQDELMTV